MHHFRFLFSEFPLHFTGSAVFGATSIVVLMMWRLRRRQNRMETMPMTTRFTTRPTLKHFSVVRGCRVITAACCAKKWALARFFWVSAFAFIGLTFSLLQTIEILALISANPMSPSKAPVHIDLDSIARQRHHGTLLSSESSVLSCGLVFFSPFQLLMSCRNSCIDAVFSRHVL